MTHFTSPSQVISVCSYYFISILTSFFRVQAQVCKVSLSPMCMSCHFKNRARYWSLQICIQMGGTNNFVTMYLQLSERTRTLEHKNMWIILLLNYHPELLFHQARETVRLREHWTRKEHTLFSEHSLSLALKLSDCIRTENDFLSWQFPISFFFMILF